jgi:HEAT repeat protein
MPIRKIIFRTIALFLVFSLFLEQSGFAQVGESLDISGSIRGMLSSLRNDSFRPSHLRYLSFPERSDSCSVIIDKGSHNGHSNTDLVSSIGQLMAYFLTGVTLPDESFWVNLRPDVPDNIIDPELAQTDAGRVMLEADLQLKKDMALFTSPGTHEGKKYWDALFQKAQELFGDNVAGVPTIVRPWIVPGEIIISSTPTDVYVYKANLKVLLEEDYLKGSNGYLFKDQRSKELNEYSAGLIRELILPRLTEEVNSAKRYAPLRQVYYSLILAQWFKHYFRGNYPSYQSRINQGDLSGLVSGNPWSVEEYFNAYRRSFREGEYDIKEQAYSLLQGTTIRQYKSGGLQFGNILTGNPQARIIFGSKPGDPPLSSYAVQAKIRPDLSITEGPVTVSSAASPEAAGSTDAAESGGLSDLNRKESSGKVGHSGFLGSQVFVRAKRFALALLFAAGLGLSTMGASADDGRPASYNQKPVPSQPLGADLSADRQAELANIKLALEQEEAALAQDRSELARLQAQKQQLIRERDRIMSKLAGDAVVENNALSQAQAVSAERLSPRPSAIVRASAAEPLADLEEVSADIQDPLPATVQERPLQLDQAAAEGQVGGEYSKIIAMGNSGEAKHARKLLRILKQHDTGKGNGVSLNTLLKQACPVGVADPNPALSIEATLGNLLGFINSSAIRLMSLYDETEPANQEAAAWALGMLKDSLDKKFTVLGIGFGIDKRDVIEGLGEAMTQSKNPRVRIAASRSFRVFNDTRNPVIGSEDIDVRLKYCSKAISDPEWLVRFNVAQILMSTDDPRAKHLIIELIGKENEPLVLYSLAQAPLQLYSLGAVLPLIQSTARLKFDTSQDDLLYAIDTAVFDRIVDSLAGFGGRSQEARSRLISALIENISDVHYQRGGISPDEKYRHLNNNLLPMFRELAKRIQIQPQEIRALTQGLSSKITQELLNILERSQRPSAALISLNETEESYNANIARLFKDNPGSANKLGILFKNKNHSALEAIMLFDRGNASHFKRAMAAYLLIRLDNGLSARAFIAGLQDSHPLVKATAARALRDYVLKGGFIYTGKDGDLIKALRSCAKEEDWIVTGFLIDTLRLLGDSDALEVIKELVSEHKHPLLQAVAGEALCSFSNQGAAMAQTVMWLLSPDHDISVLINAVGIAKDTLSSLDNPQLIDRIIYTLVDYPQNPKNYANYGVLWAKAVEALRVRPESSADRLKALIRSRSDRGDSSSIGVVNKMSALLQEVAAEETVAYSQSDELSLHISCLGDPRQTDINRLSAISSMARICKGSGNSRALSSLILLIEKEPKSSLVQAAIAAAVAIDDPGQSLAYETGEYPLVNALSIVASGNGKNTQFQTRKEAILALGKTNRPESLKPLIELLKELSSENDFSLLLAASQSSAVLLERIPEDSLLEALLSTYICKLTATPDRISSYPEIAGIHAQLVKVFTAMKDKTIPVLERMEKEIRSEKDPDRFESDQLSAIVYLKSLIRQDKNGVPADILADLPQQVREELEQWALGQGIDVNAPIKHPSLSESIRLERAALLKIADLGLPHCISPAVIQLLREALISPDPDINTCSAFCYIRIPVNSIPQAPNRNKDVSLLAQGLENKSLSFHSRLFRVIALGNSGSIYASSPLLNELNSLEDKYPGTDTGGSKRMREKTLLSEAITWALANLQKGKPSDQAPAKIGKTAVEDAVLAKIAQGGFNYPETLLLESLKADNPAVFNDLVQRMNLSPLPSCDPRSVVTDDIAKLSKADVSKDLLEIEAGFHFQALDDARERGRAMVNFEGKDGRFTAGHLLFGADSDIKIAAALYLGKLGQPAYVGVLQTALSQELNKRNQLVAGAILRALSSFKSAKGVADLRFPSFKLALGHSLENPSEGNVSVLTELAFALGTSGDERVIPLIEKLLDNQDELIRESAVGALDSFFDSTGNQAAVLALINHAKNGYRFHDQRGLANSEELTASAETALNKVMRYESKDKLRATPVIRAVYSCLADQSRGRLATSGIHPVCKIILDKFDPSYVDSPWFNKIQSTRSKIWKNLVLCTLATLGLIGAVVFFGWIFLKWRSRHLLANYKSGPESPSAGNANASAARPQRGQDDRQARGTGIEEAVSVVAQRILSDNSPDEESMVQLVNALARATPRTDQYSQINHALRQVHPDSFAAALRFARSSGNPELLKRINLIISERPGDMAVGMARFTTKIHEWKAELAAVNILNYAALEKIVRVCRDSVEVFPFLPEQGVGLLEERSDLIEVMIDLIKRTISRGTNELSGKEKNNVESKKLIDQLGWAGQYFIRYRAVFDQMSEINQAKGYEDPNRNNGFANGNGNGRHNGYSNGKKTRTEEFWKEIYGLGVMRRHGEDKLSYLLEGMEGLKNKIHPGESRQLRDWHDAATSVYDSIPPHTLGSGLRWRQRKKRNRILAILIPIVPLASAVYKLNYVHILNNPTLGNFVGPVLGLTVLAFSGFVIAVSLSWYEILNSWIFMGRSYRNSCKSLDSLLLKWKDSFRGPTGPPLPAADVPHGQVVPGLAGAAGNALGGIDFTNIKAVSSRVPVAVREAGLEVHTLSLGRDDEFDEIQKLTKAEIIPSVLRIIEYLQKASDNDEFLKKIERVRGSVADMLRIEEGRMSPTDASELELLRLLEQDIPADNFKSKLALLECKPA